MKTYRFAPIEGRGRTVALWLIISMLGDAVSAAGYIFDLNMLSRLDSLTQAELRTWDMAALLSVPAILIYIINIVLVCFWTYRAAANAHAFRKGLTTSPPWAVGWYFIPFASLWKPFGVMKEIWRASFSREGGRPTPWDGVLSGWWTFWIISCITGNISFRLALHASEPSTFVVSAWAGLLSAITGIAAAWFLRSVVIRISQAQTATQAHRVAAGEGAPADAPSEVAPE
ncbi:MAG TPA: DUF4328 domain-containing protein [Brevundimonas sp.]|nr:DUF4328 domain-containing protein [Brevundimonas sp.]